MPAVEGPSTAGYAVRGTVRSNSKGRYLLDLFKTYGDRFTYTLVEDLTRPGAFNKALDDMISAVIHIAGAVYSDDLNTSETLDVNVGSVESLLKSMASYGKHVQRFIYMSSAQAMLGYDNLFHIYTEDDWNEKAVAAYREKGKNIDAQGAYQESKVLAGRSVVDYVAKNNGEIGWDAIRFVPAWMSLRSFVFLQLNATQKIYGPITHEVHSTSQLDLSTKMMYEYLRNLRDHDKVTEYASEYIDVRDVADAFVASLRVEAAGGERFVLDAGTFTYQNLCLVLNDAAHEKAPTLEGIARENPDAPKFSLPGPFRNPDKARRMLQLRPFKTLGECVVDTYQSIRERAL